MSEDEMTPGQTLLPLMALLKHNLNKLNMWILFYLRVLLLFKTNFGVYMWITIVYQ